MRCSMVRSRSSSTRPRTACTRRKRCCCCCSAAWQTRRVFSEQWSVFMQGTSDSVNVLKGHGFSLAAREVSSSRASAPEGQGATNTKNYPGVQMFEQTVDQPAVRRDLSKKGWAKYLLFWLVVSVGLIFLLGHLSSKDALT